mmetsp:Transcript_47725/g.112987  ORF Transcript_47725/g.112987 Transcript_47725/m.112987 type:complete len:382 (+) Transcript_47725:610-1755(+)
MRAARTWSRVHGSRLLLTSRSTRSDCSSKLVARIPLPYVSALPSARTARRSGARCGPSTTASMAAVTSRMDCRRESSRNITRYHDIIVQKRCALTGAAKGAAGRAEGSTRRKYRLEGERRWRSPSNQLRLCDSSSVGRKRWGSLTRRSSSVMSTAGGVGVGGTKSANVDSHSWSEAWTSLRAWRLTSAKRSVERTQPTRESTETRSSLERTLRDPKDAEDSSSSVARAAVPSPSSMLESAGRLEERMPSERRVCFKPRIASLSLTGGLLSTAFITCDTTAAFSSTGPCENDSMISIACDLRASRTEIACAAGRAPTARCSRPVRKHRSMSWKSCCVKSTQPCGTPRSQCVPCSRRCGTTCQCSPRSHPTVSWGCGTHGITT